jgi:hypothetical protein
LSIARSEKIANVRVAPKIAIASWSPRSSSSERTIAVRNWPIANCTATSVTVSTIDVSVRTAVAIVVRIDCASGALPTMLCDSSPFSFGRSIAMVASESTIPTTTPSEGMIERRWASACTIRNRRMAAT